MIHLLLSNLNYIIPLLIIIGIVAMDHKWHYIFDFLKLVYERIPETARVIVVVCLLFVVGTVIVRTGLWFEITHMNDMGKVVSHMQQIEATRGSVGLQEYYTTILSK